MNFQVPQFIEIEDKAIGPLTFKQFIYLAGGAGLAFICYAWLGVYIGAVPIVAILSLAAALAFYKVNDRPFINIAEAFIRFHLSNKLFLWKKIPNQANQGKIQTKEPRPTENISTIPKDRLHELTWRLNIKEVIDESNSKKIT
ncbi:MAG: PrgI family protein [Candidatus Paceibacterota bacterium]|jgi:hypothetical protein